MPAPVQPEIDSPSLDTEAAAQLLDDLLEGKLYPQQQTDHEASMMAADLAGFYGTPSGWHWIWKPLPTTVIGFSLFIVLLVGQCYVPWLDVRMGWHLGTYTDIVRIAMLLGCFIMLAVAAPVLRPANWKPEDDLKMMNMHDDFQRRFRR